jgi:hypothetical protein
MNAGHAASTSVKAPLSTIIWSGLGLVLLALFAGFSGNYYLNFFRGPLRVNDDYLLAVAAKPASGLIAYVQLESPQLVPTGFTEEASRGEKVYESTPYFFVEVRDKLLLVKTHPERDGGRLTGPLQAISAKVDVDVRNRLVANDPALREKLLPMIINGAAAFTVAGYLGLAIFIPAAALCSFFFARAIATWGHPTIGS